MTMTTLIIVAIIVLETTKLIYYLPLLLISGIVAGIFIGILAAQIIKRLPLDKIKQS